jgi:pantoate--beta-alanine ligase
MQMIDQPTPMQQHALRLRGQGKRIGLVPTMGFLHGGHMSLIQEAKKQCDITVVSIFVNPIQFGPSEDLDRYPRDLQKDKELCAKEGVHIIFAPGAAAMYPDRYSTFVIEDSLSRSLEGASRPSHFRGVCTVVAKLFHIVVPHVVVFGQKDAQQALVIRRMVRDLNFPTEVVIAPTVRDADGLAMSSRNIQLTSAERKQALALPAALNWARDAFRNGQKKAAELRQGMEAIILRGPNARIDYIAFTHPETLEPVDTAEKGSLVLLAVWIGKTRLIDNMVIG